MTSATPQRILITRLSAIGDCVHTMPLACAVRDCFPGARIVWAVERGAATLVATLAEVDRVLIVPKDWLHSPQAIWQLRHELVAEQFDLVLDPQSLLKSSALGWLTGARRRIGFAPPVGREIAPWLNSERVQSRAVHRVERYLELLQPLGIGLPPVRFGLRVAADADALAAEVIARHDCQAGYAVFSPGAGWDSRLWPIERFAEVARRLAERDLVSLVVWGGQRERQWAEQIVGAASGAAILAPQTTLLQLTALIRRARLFVGCDSGPLHLAGAVGTPCVGLFGSTRREATGPYGPGHTLLQAAYDDSGDRKRPGADNWAMRQISTQMVIDACIQILAGDRTDSVPDGLDRAA
ncbi:MAG TPA: glycosyltransferase family 9 protein [Pirellulaceae bacterium]|nr:glycosyltransferase family 9 protein [Pirellulaceae bacterium]